MRRLSSLEVGLGATVLIVLGLAVAGFALPSLRDETPTTALGPPQFVDETASAGIDHVYAGDAGFAVGGGVAVFDCDGNGKPDLYLAGGSNPAALYRNDSRVGGPLKFTRLPDPATDLVGVLGAYPIDIAGDGHVDLVVLRKGETVLLRGLGDCRFERANEALSFDGGNAMTTAFSAKWEEPAALPTLALGRYLGLEESGARSFDCAPNALFRPSADGTGYGRGTPLPPGFCTLSILFSDWDRSGLRDLRITNDREYYVGGQDQLWRIANGEPPRLYTDADGWVSLQIWGMGIASFDLTGHGYPDVFLTSQGDNKLQTLTTGPGHPTYRDIALKRGVTAAQPFTGGDVRPSTAWHPEFQDVNNDGFIDLFISKGNVSAMPDYASRDPNDLFLGQADGTFKEAADTAGILNYGHGRGAALADFSLDGMLDLVEVNYGEGVRLWRNVGAGDASRPVQMGNWLAIRPTQPGPNRDAIGAWIEVQVGKRVVRRELTVGGGHAGGQLGWTHFGLGQARSAQVRLTWPDGEVGPWLHVDANHFIIVDRATSQAQPWLPV
ncbi:MAG: CRTAC1 family protein [Chloroflexota bacterium]|nr:CRTAC1 family protein [Chloroflexota bacterium]